QSHKCDLGLEHKYDTKVQYLAPAHEAAVRNYTTCPFASEGCASTCIKTTGQMVYPTHARARIMKTLLHFLAPDAYFEQLRWEIMRHSLRSAARGYKPAVRLNGTSDVPFWDGRDQRLDFKDLGKGATFYDYTKRPMTRGIIDAVDDGWHFTYSLSEHPDSFRRSASWATLGVNTAVVVSGRLGVTRKVAAAVAAELVNRGAFYSRPTVSGDDHDLRFLDPKCGGWVILAAKGGKAKRDTTGFVVRFDEDRLLGTDASVVDCIVNEKEAA
ncbi:MAG: hypothetical protein P1V36_00450, partial [Planctomycetota bacterium]|nr:hypothetical protein [Planctomycetota bacterium]